VLKEVKTSVKTTKSGLNSLTSTAGANDTLEDGRGIRLGVDARELGLDWRKPSSGIRSSLHSKHLPQDSGLAEQVIASSLSHVVFEQNFIAEASNN
jgi:hypothetical protein